MLPTSISTRVIATFGAVMALAVALLAGGVLVATHIRYENDRVARLGRLLNAEDAQDQVQRQLRLSVGDVTRLAEKRQPIGEADFARAEKALRLFRAPHASSDRSGAETTEQARPFVVRRAAETRFARLSATLLDDARHDPAAIKRHMPLFVDALRDLERARTEVRQLLVRRIDMAATHNSREMADNVRMLLGAGLFVLLFLVASTLWLRRQVIHPIVDIADRLRQFSRGQADDADVPGLARADELGDLARGVSEYRDAVEQRREAERRIEFLAHHDPLTGLPNRALFEDRLRRELARAQRSGERVAVFAIDLDEFKSINDRFGHAGGDEALRNAARLLTACVRADDTVARLGGDEFAIVQTSVDQPVAAEALLRRLFAACDRTAGDEVPVQMSVGVALSDGRLADEQLHNLADMAMYRAKAEGRHTGRFFDDKLREEVRRRWRLSRDLEGAMDRAELHLVYQPIADAATLEPVGHEALLRWAHPQLGNIPPDQFIPLAESNGRIDPIGLWVAERAMMAAAAWGGSHTLALNLSPIQFRRPHLARELLDLAERHGVAPARLEFEVTEGATLLGSRRELVMDVLRDLQGEGASIVMDDFGTGSSSLGNLRDVRFDKLKIDRSFVATMETHPPSASIVRCIAALGNSLGIPVVAEGVETESQLALLRRWSIDQVQGYLIGRPQRLDHGMRPQAIASA